MDETMEVGCDVGEPVSPDYGPAGNAFNGKVRWVQIDITRAERPALAALNQLPEIARAIALSLR